MFKGKLSDSLLLLGLMLWAGAIVYAQGTAFTYQGKLTDSGNPASGQYDLQFKLFDTVTLGTGTPQGGTVTVTNVTVAAGIFTVQLDFGSCPTCFDGSARFLEIAVKQTSGSTFTTLGPRQPITSTPYAIKSQNAATADGLSVACVNCVTSSQIGSVNGSAVSGTIPVASVPAGSANYVQNTTSQQATANFNISGIGAADTFDATTKYSIGGQRVLSVANGNVFVGVDTGNSNTTGFANSFFGNGSGFSNTTGIANSFFGDAAGTSNTTGSINSFFGQFAGLNNMTGISNNFFGVQAGLSNTTGSSNNFFGRMAGSGNTTGNSNTIIGEFANVGADGLNFATAIGAFALVNTSDTIVLGKTAGTYNGNPRPADTVVVPGTLSGNLLSGNILNATMHFTVGNFPVLKVSGGNPVNSNTFVGVGAGASNTPNSNGNGNRNSFFGNLAGNANTTGFGNAFFGVEAGTSNIDGRANSFFGDIAGQLNTSGRSNSFFGASAGENTMTGNFNSFFGTLAGSLNTTAQKNTFIGIAADFNTANPTGDNNTLLGANTQVISGVNNSTAIGSHAQVTQNNSLVLGSINGVNNATADTKVGIGTTTPAAALDVRGDVKLGATGQFFAPGGAENLRILRGRIAVNGTLLEGTGFTSSRIATGHYRITYTTAFVGTPAVTVTAVGTVAPQIATINGGSTLAVDVFTWSIAGAAGDAEFHFIIIGSR